MIHGQEFKQEAGFAHFEGRNYRALIRHMTMVLPVGDFAASGRLRNTVANPLPAILEGLAKTAPGKPRTTDSTYAPKRFDHDLVVLSNNVTEYLCADLFCS